MGPNPFSPHILELSSDLRAGKSELRKGVREVASRSVLSVRFPSTN